MMPDKEEAANLAAEVKAAGGTLKLNGEDYDHWLALAQSHPRLVITSVYNGNGRGYCCGVYAELLKRDKQDGDDSQRGARLP
jgi:hypothetical protein